MTRIPARYFQGEVVRPQDVAENAVLTVLRVPPEVAGTRLDRFVQSQLKNTSRTRAQVIIENSAYGEGGRRFRSSERVRPEQLIYLWRPAWDEEIPDTEIGVLYEDEHVMAIDKPANTPVHPTARYYQSTVVKLLERMRPGEHLRLCHRLDKETSGVLMTAKSLDADRRLKRQFAGMDPDQHRPDPRGRRVDKTYLAIVHGQPSNARFRVDKPLELDRQARYRVKMRIGVTSAALPATTDFEVLESRVRPTDGSRYSMVACQLLTGRQHQIRVHLTSEGYPIVGDKLYGLDEQFFGRNADGELTEADRQRLELDRHALHAAALALDHPAFGTRLRVESPLPAELQTFWSGLRESEAPSSDG